MSLGEQLRQLRIEKNLSQPELAELASIEQSYLSKLENGKSVPSNEIFRSLLGALEIDLNRFLARFDLAAERQHLMQVPDIEHWVKQREKERVGSQRNYLYMCSAMIVLSVTLFYIGFSKQLFSETHYNYVSQGILMPDEPNDFFSTWGRLIHVKTKMMSKEERVKQSAAAEIDVMKRKKEKTLLTRENRGRSFEKEVTGGRHFFQKRGTEQIPRAINSWLQTLGVMLFSMGVMGFFMERRLYKL